MKKRRRLDEPEEPQHADGAAAIHDLSGESEADAWHDGAPKLARWAEDRLLNRDDAYRRYLPLGERTVVRKSGGIRPTELMRGRPTLDILERHFRGEGVDDLVGLHIVSRQATCKACWLLVPSHGTDSGAYGSSRAAHYIYTAALTQQIRKERVDVLWFDDHAGGGQRIVVLFSCPVPAERAYGVAQGLRSAASMGYGCHVVRHLPGLKPQQTFYRDGARTGEAARLPGCRPDGAVWSRVWHFERRRWLAGREAVDAILATSR